MPFETEDGKQVYKWKVELLKTEKYWLGFYKFKCMFLIFTFIFIEWFKGLTDSFLKISIPKLLMLAEKERMDKDLTIAQMQGKFKLVVI